MRFWEEWLAITLFPYWMKTVMPDMPAVRPERLPSPVCMPAYIPACFRKGWLRHYTGTNRRCLSHQRNRRHHPLAPGITAVYGASVQCGRILIRDKEIEQYGYADLEGHVVIEPVFSYADDFENGIARAEKDGIFVLIDLSGNLITK